RFREVANTRQRRSPIRDPALGLSDKFLANVESGTRADGSGEFCQAAPAPARPSDIEGQQLRQPDLYQRKPDLLTFVLRSGQQEIHRNSATQQGSCIHPGSAEPSPSISSRTIRRPGSSTAAYPLRPSSASSVDFPPPE